MFAHANIREQNTTNLACWGFRTLGLLQMMHGGFYGFIMLFFMFETWSPFVSIVWKVTATLFSCETPAVLWTKELYPPFNQHESD